MQFERIQIPMRRWMSAFGAAPFFLLTAGAGAEPHVCSDQHMRSNFTRRIAPEPRPPIQIGDPAPSATAVVETTLSINPHGWQPGGAGAAGGATARRGSTPFSSPSTAAPSRTSAVRGTGWSQGMRRTMR